MDKPLNIAIAGLGTVGAGVVKIINDNETLLTQRAGRAVRIVAVSARDRHKDRGVDLSSYEWVDNPLDLAGRDDVDMIIELIGGAEGIAFDLIKAALENGIDIVTANKALISAQGPALAALSETHGPALMYEAAVAGGIPIIKALVEGYAANHIKAVYGILNGTCNYILSEMSKTGEPFVDALKKAQGKGYAEADPTFDIEGIDTAHKLSILSGLSYGIKPKYQENDVEGITGISDEDISFAKELGYRIKLLGITQNINGSVLQYVAPCLIPCDHILASVDDAFNAVLVDGDFVEQGVFIGKGAGAGPTASAVVADIIDLAAGRNRKAFGVPAAGLKDADFVDTGAHESRFYLRLTVIDRPGVLAELTTVMKEYGISVESFLQRSRDPNKPVSIVLTTHNVATRAIREAVEKISRLDVTTGTPCLLRIEHF